MCYLLEGHHVGGLQAFGSILDGKLHLLFGFQFAVAIALNGGKVNEHILTTIATNKAVALGCIKPLDGSNKTF